MTVTHTLSACVDCALILANGESGQGDAHDAALVAAHVVRWGDDAGHLVLSGAEPVEFMTSPCGACGSELAGSRFAVAALR